MKNCHDKYIKLICNLLAVLVIASCFSCSKIFAKAGENTPVPGQEEPYTAETTLTAKKGYYEELDLSDNWQQDKVTKEIFTKYFYIKNYDETDNGNIFLLNIENFDSAYHVYINGNELSSSVIENDITSYVKQGENILEIHAGKIMGTIKLIYTPLVVVGNVSVTPKIEDGTVTVDINVKNRSEEPASGTLEVSVYELGIFKNRKRATHSGVGTAEVEFLAEGETTGLLEPVTITLRDFDETRIWSVDNPFLYELVVRLNNNTTSVRFGMKEILARTGESYLIQNGEPLFLFGLSLDETAVSNAGDLLTYFNVLKSYNINTLVGEKVQFDDEWYEVAEEVGMLIYEEDAFPCNSVSPFDNQNKAFSFPTVANITADDEATKEQIATFRLQRKYCGIIASDVELAKESYSGVGIAVEYSEGTFGRGAKLVLDISLINDLNIDMSTAVTTVSLVSGQEVLLEETKEYESLKKLGTTGRDILTREFSFVLPNSIKDGANLDIKIVVEYDEMSRTIVVPVEVFGGETYESPFSLLIAIVSLSAFGVVVGIAIVTAMIKRRIDRKK